jgi:uncharacterized protein involved in exopolysaccharide biosynthesis
MMKKNDLDLFELIRILLGHKILIVVITAIVAIGAVIYSLTTPEIYSSKASFFAVGEEGNQLPINIPGLSGIASGLMGSNSPQKADNMITVMQSRTFCEAIINEFQLLDYFELDHADSLRNMDDALILMRTKVLSMGYDSGSGLITVRAYTKDKQLSLDIVAYIVQKLDQYNREQKLTQGKLNRVFLEGRVNEVKSKLDSLIAANRRFQESSKAIHLESQAKAMVTSYSALIAESMKADIELELAQANYGSQSPMVQEAKLLKQSIQKQIRELEASGETPEYLINIGSLPEITAQYLLIEMDMQIYKTLFEYLYPQYEAARLSELRDMPSIEILDAPRLAGRRDYPKRALICIVSTLAGFLFAVLLAFMLEIVKRNRHRIFEKNP